MIDFFCDCCYTWARHSFVLLQRRTSIHLTKGESLWLSHFHLHAHIVVLLPPLGSAFVPIVVEHWMLDSAFLLLRHRAENTTRKFLIYLHSFQHLRLHRLVHIVSLHKGPRIPIIRPRHHKIRRRRSRATNLRQRTHSRKRMPQGVYLARLVVVSA